jgi:hypothetical protein
VNVRFLTCFFRYIFSCVPAHPAVDANLVNTSCHPYQFSNKSGFCTHFIGKWDVYGSTEDQKLMEVSLKRISIGKQMLEVYLPNVQVRDSCLEVFNVTYCRYSFPKCDLTSVKPLAKPVCRETCEDAFKLCDKEVELLEGFNMKQRNDALDGNGYPLYWDILNCSHFQFRNGGDNPECYYSRHLNSKSIFPRMV